MSDYGFKTSDNNRATVLNAKNPIFGFDMRHKPRAFKTFHIVDTKTSPIHTGSVSVPSIQTGTYSWAWNENIDASSVRELVARVKHGYDFRPVGYASISGTLKYSLNVRIQQTQVAGSYGGNYTKNLTAQKGKPQLVLVPNISGTPFASETGVGLFDATADLTAADFSGTVWPWTYPKNIMTGQGYGPAYHPEFGFDLVFCPKAIEVTIDDEYIYFYRNYIWSDTIRRVIYKDGNGNITDDLRERVKVSEQFTGSEYNVTVYLCPFPLEELLTTTNDPIPIVTNPGIWDESLWDSGKEWS